MCGIQNVPNPNRPNWDRWFPIIIISLIVWAGLSLIPIAVINCYEQSGQFGDAFGSANSLFSCAAFILGMIALIKQIEQTEKTIQISTMMREDGKQQQRLNTLLEIRKSLNNLYQACTTIITVRHEHWDLTVEAKLQFSEAVYDIRGNKLALELIFGERANELNILVDTFITHSTGMFSITEPSTASEIGDYDRQQLELIRIFDTVNEPIRVLWNEGN